MHTIDDVLEPQPNHPTQKEAATVKNMKKGEAAWVTRKTALGWVVDSLSKTLEMPPHHTERLQKIFDDLLDWKRAGQKQWEHVLGKLRFVSVAIPAAPASLAPYN